MAEKITALMIKNGKNTNDKRIAIGEAHHG
jgi:hypothetical protein